jgi:hypothetical protein
MFFRNFDFHQQLRHVTTQKTTVLTVIAIKAPEIISCTIHKDINSNSRVGIFSNMVRNSLEVSAILHLCATNHYPRSTKKIELCYQQCKRALFEQFNIQSTFSFIFTLSHVWGHE